MKVFVKVALMFQNYSHFALYQNGVSVSLTLMKKYLLLFFQDYQLLSEYPEFFPEAETFLKEESHFIFSFQIFFLQEYLFQNKALCFHRLMIYIPISVPYFHYEYLNFQIQDTTYQAKNHNLS